MNVEYNGGPLDGCREALPINMDDPNIKEMIKQENSEMIVQKLQIDNLNIEKPIINTYILKGIKSLGIWELSFVKAETIDDLYCKCTIPNIDIIKGKVFCQNCGKLIKGMNDE